MSEAQADRIGELTDDIKRLIQENDGKDDLIRADRAVVRADDRRTRPIDGRDARALEDAHAALEQETAEPPGEPRRLQDGDVTDESTSHERR